MEDSRECKNLQTVLGPIIKNAKLLVLKNVKVNTRVGLGAETKVPYVSVVHKGGT